MKKVAFILAGIIAIFGIAFSYSLPTKTTSSTTLLVGTNSEYPPYALIKNKEIAGFDIDVAKEVAKRLGKEVKFLDMPFEALLTELSLKHVDFVAGGMTKTEKRAKRVLFSKPHHGNDPLVIVSSKEAPIHQLSDLVGKQVIVNEGYWHEQFISEYEDIEIIRLPAPADAILALNAGRADAFITVQSIVNSYQNETKNTDFHTGQIESITEEVSLVFAKDNVDLAKQVEEIIDAMEIDGTLAELKKKWKLS